MNQLTVVDLALHAASICGLCRDMGRPLDESRFDQGDVFTHRSSGISATPCQALQIWVLIRRIEGRETR